MRLRNFARRRWPRDGAVDAEVDDGARETETVKDLAGGDMGRDAAGALLTADVERHPHRIASVDDGELTVDEPGPFQGEQAAADQCHHVIHQSADHLGGVHRGDRDGQILRQAQRLVGADDVARTEAGDAAQQHAGGDSSGREQVQHRVGDEPAAGAFPFGEIGGELVHLVPVARSVRSAHGRPANSAPSIAAATPSTTLTTMLAAAGQNWRSSARRCVSNIHVENVV